MEWRCVPEAMDCEPSFLQGGVAALNRAMEQFHSQRQGSETPPTHGACLSVNSQVVADSKRSQCVQTDSLEEAAEVLEETGRVILCGFPGTGKTTVGHALLRRWREKGFKPYILTKLKDWHAHIGPGRRSLVLMDGLLGVVRVKRQQLEEWSGIVRNMLELMKTGECRVVVTVYPHVLQELQQLETERQSPLLDSCAVVWLMKEEVDREVKRQVLDFHLTQLGLQPSQQQEVVERIVQADSSGPAFLWCCRYLLDHWQAVEDPATVFTSPVEAYSVLLKQMCLHETHGDSFAALFVLTMLGKSQFLQTRVRAQVELLEHGFHGYLDDHLAKYEDILLDSVLSTEGHGFISRDMYDAAGLALGRSYRLPTLLRVCDATFLVQNVSVNVTEKQISEKKKALRLQIGSKPIALMAPNNSATLSGCQPLIERLHEELAKGNLRTISKQSALQCPEFLGEMEEYCKKNKHRENHLLGVLDAEHGLPLIYWSVHNKCHVLSEWCMRKMTTDTDLHLILHKTLLACALSPHFAHELRPKAEQLTFQGSIAEETCHFPTKNVVLTHELLAKVLMEEDEGSGVVMMGRETTQQQLLYLCDASKPIETTLLKLQLTGEPSLSASPPMISILVSHDTVSVQVSDSKDWYLALRLLADREVDQTDRDGNTLLHIAAHKRNLEAITLAVKSGASLTQKNNKGLTPYQLAQQRREIHIGGEDGDRLKADFFSAIRDGDKVKVKTYLCYGCCVEDKNHDRLTGLTVACKYRQEDIADLMICLGANVNINKSGYIIGCTALQYACMSSLSRTAKLLVEHNADISAKSKGNWQAIHFASQCESPTASADITHLLLDAGADVNVRNWSGWTPLHCASRYGHTHCAKVLIDHGADVNARDRKSNTPLHCAVQSGYTETLTLLINHGADLNAKDEDGRTPLHLAYLTSRPDMMTQLVEAGAETGRVHQAVVRGDVDALMTLLQQGVDVNQHDTSMGCSPLHAACLMGHADIVTCLLQHGAQVNAVDQEGRTPVHCACKSDATDIVTCLLQHRAQVSAVDQEGRTPLHWACAAGHTQVAQQLVDHGADVNVRDKSQSTPLHEAVRKGNTEATLCLIEHGASVNVSIDRYGTTPLHTACEKGHTETVECLLQHGADVNIMSKCNATPLHTACRDGHTQTVECLLQHGADVNAVTEGCETPLHTACEHGDTETVEHLLQHGAKVNVVSFWQRSPLDLARKRPHKDIVQLLSQHGAVSGRQLRLNTF